MRRDIHTRWNYQDFVWDEEKAKDNLIAHQVSFETAREVFMDAQAVYVEASADQEHRLAAIGLTFSNQLMFVVHGERAGNTLRIISARKAETPERKIYEDD